MSSSWDPWRNYIYKDHFWQITFQELGCEHISSEASIQPTTGCSGRQKSRDGAPSHACFLCYVKGIPQFSSTLTMGGNRRPLRTLLGLLLVRTLDRDTTICPLLPQSQSDLRDPGQPGSPRASTSLCLSQNRPQAPPAAQVMAAGKEFEAWNQWNQTLWQEGDRRSRRALSLMPWGHPGSNS